MSAPVRPRHRETARLLAESAGADFAGELFLAEVEAHQTRTRGSDSGRQIRQALTGFGDPLATYQQIMAGAQTHYRQRLRQWERHAPQRRAAQAAYERANRQRAAELGIPARMPVTNALAWSRPLPPGGIG